MKQFHTNYFKLLFISLFLINFINSNAQTRIQTSINSNWKFQKKDIPEASQSTYDDSLWESVNIPHTWNASDVLDDKAGYYRGVGWYRKNFNVPFSMKGKQVYIYFEASNQDTEVYVNGKKVGVHFGGYTAFCFNITNLVHIGKDNLLSVKVNNSYNEDVAPVGGDLCHFGGIYRDVYLIAMHNTHFDIDYFAASGVFMTTPKVAKNLATLEINSRIVGQINQKLKIVHTVIDPEGNQVLELTKKIKVKTKEPYLLRQDTEITKPLLWTAVTPNLYHVNSKILDRNGVILDEVTNPLGFRTLVADKDKGILINGKPTFIKGIGKHQDYDKLGYAVPNEVSENDIRLLKETGANLVRSHYPLDPIIYDTCDKLGVMVWGKMPIMDKISHTKAFMDNSKYMMQEIMYQNYNRPSFILWGFACEIFGDMDWYWPKPQDPIKVKENLEKTVEFSTEFEKFIRKIDPYRLTANDFHTDPTPEFYKQTNQTSLNMVNGWNIYQGWYHNNLDAIGATLQTFRNYNTEVPFLIAEFGAGSDPRIHTYEPTIFDFSIEYQNMLHERYLSEIKNYDFVHGLCLWTLVDFQVDHRPDAVPHINSKGILRSDRTPKDAYYVYQANWSEKPMVYIASRDWTKRKELVVGDIASRPITVYSNQSEIELIHNGKLIARKKVENHKAVFTISFVEGVNQLEALAYKNNEILKDFIEIDFTFISDKIDKNGIPEDGLCINVGQSRTYMRDEITKNTWIPGKAYQKGNFGHKNGNYYRIWNHMTSWQGIREGVQQNIFGTEIDPVFQTFLIGITDYQIDVPNGTYEVSLLFTEPFDENRKKKPLEKTGTDKNGARVFDVSINDMLLIENLNLAADYGNTRAVKKSFIIPVNQNKGISIKLNPKKGEPVLSGIKIMKK